MRRVSGLFGRGGFNKQADQADMEDERLSGFAPSTSYTPSARSVSDDAPATNASGSPWATAATVRSRIEDQMKREGHITGHLGDDSNQHTFGRESRGSHGTREKIRPSKDADVSESASHRHQRDRVASSEEERSIDDPRVGSRKNRNKACSIGFAADQLVWPSQAHVGDKHCDPFNAPMVPARSFELDAQRAAAPDVGSRPISPALGAGSRPMSPEPLETLPVHVSPKVSGLAQGFECFADFSGGGFDSFNGFDGWRQSNPQGNAGSSAPPETAPIMAPGSPQCAFNGASPVLSPTNPLTNIWPGPPLSTQRSPALSVAVSPESSSTLAAASPPASPWGQPSLFHGGSPVPAVATPTSSGWPVVATANSQGMPPPVSAWAPSTTQSLCATNDQVAAETLKASAGEEEMAQTPGPKVCPAGTGATGDEPLLLEAGAEHHKYSSGPFDEAIFAALAHLPQHTLVDMLQRLAKRRPEEVALAVGSLSLCQPLVRAADDHNDAKVLPVEAPQSVAMPPLAAIARPRDSAALAGA